LAVNLAFPINTVTHPKPPRINPFTSVALLLAIVLPPSIWAATWGADSHPTRTTASHGRRVIGYITQWDAWKDSGAGLPAKGYLNHLNVDYSQYTHLNFSFFGVAVDGSLHSGDFRNKDIWQTNQVQSPAPLLDGDTSSSWDYWLIYGELNPQWGFSNPATAAAGFVPSGTGWSNTVTQLTGPLPVPLPNTNGAPGLLALAHSKGVKVMASIGGWSMCKHFPATAADPTMRGRFVNDCQRLIAMGFDGIDFDWEYPGPYAGMNFTGSSADYTNCLALIQQVRAAIGASKEISICLSATPAKLNGFDWPAMAAVVDSFNLMTYDFNGGWSDIAGHNSPLYAYPGEEGGAASASACVADLVARGVPLAKITMGIGFYGRGVVCSGSATLNGPTVKTSRTIQPDGPIVTCADYVNWSAFDGTPNYSFIRSNTNGWTRFWDGSAAVPYVTSNQYFLSYDDSRSVGLKAQYVRNQNLGGIIVWNVFGDIVPGTISNPGAKLPYSPTNRAPLVNVINSVLAGDAVPPEGTEGPVPFGSTNASSAWPTNLFAPYVDFAAWPPYDIVGVATNTGLRYVTLAFMVADLSQNAATASPASIPAWGGYTAYAATNGYRLDVIASFRALGGDVVVSFGGASGTELAAYITDTNRLKTAYQYVIDTYNATRVDFDIEGTWVADAASILRRSQVLAALQADAAAAGRELKVSLTLPVLPTGLDNNGLAVVRSAVTNGVDLACVNIMAMDYGDAAAPNPAGKMGDYAIMAATNLFNQLKSVYQAAGAPKTDAQLWQCLGITPMLGVNDVTTEVFDQTEAAELAGFARSNNVGMLSFWSLNRDQPGQSGVTQTPFQFTGIFLGPGATNSAALPSITVADAAVTEGNSGTTNLVFYVALSAAATNTVTVAYATANGTAVAPVDYFATNGVLTFAPGQASLPVAVRVVGDTNVEPDETFYLSLSNPTNATLVRAQATGTIQNDDFPPVTTATGGECALTSQWVVTYNGAAFRATLTLTNPNATNITLRTFEFDAPYTSVDWIAADAALANWVLPARSGIHFTVANGWSPAAVVPAGGSLTLTFQASPGGTPPPPAPANVRVNGVLIGGCAPVVPRFLSVNRQGNDLALTWSGPQGKTNFVQWRGVDDGETNWADAAPVLFPAGVGEFTTNWTLFGTATNLPGALYRIRIP
jgi:GH18 family chitinase